MPSVRVQLTAVALCAVLAVAGLTPPATSAAGLDIILEGAAVALGEGDDDRAIAQLDTASRYTDADIRIFVALARIHLRRGDLARAQTTLAEALGRLPAYPDALALQGDVMRAAGRLGAARASYDAALAVDPQNAAARAGRARLHVAAGERRAATDMDVVLNGETLILRLAWSDADADAGDLLSAITKLDGVLDDNPGWLPALLRRGDLHRRLSRMAAASYDLERAVELNSTSAEARFRRGLLKWDLGDWLAALDDFNRSISLDPDFGPAYVARGRLYQTIGDQAAAIESFDLAMAVNPVDTDALAHKAISECALGRHGSCLGAADAALREAPSDWRAHVARGHALLAGGSSDAAVEAYAAALAHAPSDEAQWLLAELQRHLRPRLEERGGFTWRFLAARDVSQVEELVAEQSGDWRPFAH